MRRALRWFVIVLLVTGAMAGTGALWLRGELRGSLPQLDGERRLAGLTAAVTVTRDGLGIPTIRGASRHDVARATGFLHAQDRFFQMDLSRRRSAGELAALVGARALPLDRETRIHRFRTTARRAVSLMRADQRQLLDAYSAGVNDGLASLGRPPFEYLLLGQTPQAWRAEDSVLVILSMFLTLQDDQGVYESTLGTMHDILPRPMFEFLAPLGSEWDAPIVGAAWPMPPIPGPDIYNLRERRRGKALPQRPAPNGQDALTTSRLATMEAAAGSNSFAVAGRLTANGGALVANDMHLQVRVPNTWYRAALEWPEHQLIGITLPGVPALVAGSNTHIAWGFTNAYADWGDLVVLETDAAHPDAYRTPGGWTRFERHEEILQVAGEADARQTVVWTIWGPLVAPDHRGRLRAYRWVAHAAEQLAGSMTPLEDARTVEEAFDQANGVGAPGQNIVVADRAGRIGWTIYGSIPRRVGLDGRLPSSWADGSRRWDGWLRPAEYPRVADPESGRVWTANARVTDGAAQATLGDGGYEIGSRARLIRERLFARERFTARDLLRIQLDTQATFVARWRDVLLRTLTPDATAGNPARAELRAIVEREWPREARPDSAAYRLTRVFREIASERAIAFALAECDEADAGFDYHAVRRRDAAIYQLVTQQPLHLLDPQFESWPRFLLAAADETIAVSTRNAAGTLRDRAWSEYNVTVYRHPLSPALPFAGRLLDMPYRELPGDLYTPRVHWGALAASERMIVSPGREAEGIMHMPTGQSGHPLSPFYANSHDAWVTGEPTPFLPGPAQHTLRLVP